MMPELTILVVTADPVRARAATMVALSAAALGERVQMFFHDDAVRLLVGTAAGDLTEALSAGVRIIACQTGLAANKLPFAALPDGCEAGGLVSVLASARDDRLLSF